MLLVLRTTLLLNM